MSPKGRGEWRQPRWRLSHFFDHFENLCCPLLFFFFQASFSRCSNTTRVGILRGEYFWEWNWLNELKVGWIEKFLRIGVVEYSLGRIIQEKIFFRDLVLEIFWKSMSGRIFSIQFFFDSKFWKISRNPIWNFRIFHRDLWFDMKVSSLE